MDGHTRLDPVSDSSLDRDIESLLAVEPSPEFLARVRTRVGQEPEPRRWRAPWMLAISGVAAAVVVTVFAWSARQVAPASDAPVEPLRIVETDRATRQASMPSAPAVQKRPPAVTAVAVTAQPEKAVDIDLPEVVVAENEVRTFAALVAGIRQRGFDVPVPAAPDPDRPLEIEELPPVEPLEIEPIVRVAALHAEGVRQ